MSFAALLRGMGKPIPYSFSTKQHTRKVQACLYHRATITNKKIQEKKYRPESFSFYFG